MGVYDEDIATAKELIAESGESCTIRRITPGVPDPAARWKPVVPVIADYPVSAVFLNFNTQSSGELYVAGSLIKTGDKKVLIAGADLTDISTSDQLIRADGSVWQVVNERALDPNGQCILHTLQVRR